MFACNDGYFLDGQSKVSCFDRDNDGTGEWSAESPICQSKTANIISVNPDVIIQCDCVYLVTWSVN